MSELDPELVNFFLDEAEGLLSEWEAISLRLEDSFGQEDIEAICRIAHNLKGASTSVGLKDFGEFVHRIEDVISFVVEKRIPWSVEVIQLLFKVQETLTMWSEGLRLDTEFKPSDMIEPIEAQVTKFENSGQAGSASEEVAESTPEAEENPQQVSEPAPADPAPQSIEPKTPSPEPSDSTPVDTPPAPPASTEPSETVTQEAASPTPAPPVAKPTSPKPKPKPATPAKGKRTNESIRVTTSKLDSLMQLVGEFSTHMGILSHAWTSRTFQSEASMNAIKLCGTLVRQIQEQTLALRMLSVSGLFQKLERVAKDIAREQGKPISIDVQGAHVELDKAVIEIISDSLIHVVRNAVDHGIEDGEQRLAAGKPEKATVYFKAVQDIAGVTITISDDGRGLNTKKILEKALATGLIPQNHNLTDREINNLIFAPGFSTAQKVTNISGRGVGMDVVRRSIEVDSGGQISIDSTPGQGTKFVIMIPANLNIIEALIIDLSGSLYAIPINDVQEVIDVSDFSMIEQDEGRVLFSLRGSVIPLIHLRQLLRTHGTDSAEPKKSKRPTLITCHREMSLALEVDRILGIRNIAVRELSGHLAEFSAFGGMTILGNGMPGIILKLPALVHQIIEKNSDELARISA